MAKYRHRIFEMYEFRDEAILALTPKEDRATGTTVTKLSTFQHLIVSRSASVTQVRFKKAKTMGEETDLREDLTQLADCLDKDSQVLLDFAGVETVSSATIDALVLFKQRLRTKGSRIALCSLTPAAREAFFPTVHKKH